MKAFLVCPAVGYEPVLVRAENARWGAGTLKFENGDDCVAVFFHAVYFKEVKPGEMVPLKAAS